MGTEQTLPTFIRLQTLFNTIVELTKIMKSTYAQNTIREEASLGLTMCDLAIRSIEAARVAELLRQVDTVKELRG